MTASAEVEEERGGGGCVRRVSTVRQESTTRFRIQKEGERRNPALSRKGALAE